MPYRVSDIQPLCSECQALATKQCTHCSRPLCWLHNMPYALCGACMAMYRRTQRKMQPLFLGTALLAALGLMMLYTIGAVAIVALFLGQLWVLYPLVVTAAIAAVPALFFKVSAYLTERRYRGVDLS